MNILPVALNLLVVVGFSYEFHDRAQAARWMQFYEPKFQRVINEVIQNCPFKDDAPPAEIHGPIKDDDSDDKTEKPDAQPAQPVAPTPAPKSEDDNDGWRDLRS